MTWLKTNWKQVLVMLFSLASAITIYLKPEYRAYVLVFGAALGGIGINLQPVSVGKTSAPDVFPDEDPTKKEGRSVPPVKP